MDLKARKISTELVASKFGSALVLEIIPGTLSSVYTHSQKRSCAYTLSYAPEFLEHCAPSYRLLKVTESGTVPISSMLYCKIRFWFLVMYAVFCNSPAAYSFATMRAPASFKVVALFVGLFENAKPGTNDRIFFLILSNVSNAIQSSNPTKIIGSVTPFSHGFNLTIVSWPQVVALPDKIAAME